MVITISIKQPGTDYNWALINNSNVINIIFADINFINNSGISLQYDFIVNLAGFPDQPIGAGWSYNSQLNTFTAPMINPNAILGQDLTETYSLLQDCLSDSNGANIAQTITAFEQNNLMTPGTLILMSAIKTWLLGGGQ